MDINELQLITRVRTNDKIPVGLYKCTHDKELYIEVKEVVDTATGKKNQFVKVWRVISDEQ